VFWLPDAARAEQQQLARCYSAPHAEVVRAKIVLLATDGPENTVIGNASALPTRTGKSARHAIPR
jgi:hypothetical protein